MNPTTTTETPGETGAAFVSVAAAALAWGVSARTIRRRCKSGELAARFIGGVWEVDGQAIGHADTGANSRTRPKGQTAKQSDSDLKASADSRTPDAAKGTRTDGHADTDARPIGQPSDRREIEAELRAQLEREREQNSFLRGLVEQRDRDAAELRASLREALRAMPKQLTARTPESTPIEAQERAQGATVSNQGAADVNAQQKPTARRGDGLALVRAGLKRLFGR